MESTENDRTVFRPSHKTLKIEKTDFHIPTATTTTEQSFHLKTRKTGPDNRSHLSCRRYGVSDTYEPALTP